MIRGIRGREVGIKGTIAVNDIGAGGCTPYVYLV